MSQEIVAEMVGATRSRVNIFIGRFKKFGLIEETTARSKPLPHSRVADGAMELSQTEHPRGWRRRYRARRG
jgi:hypothetical protein